MTDPSTAPQQDVAGWLESAQRAVHDVLEDHWPHSKCDRETAATIRGLAAAVQHLIGAVHTVGTQGAAAAAPVVRGRCPACGWVGLFIGDGGHITCSQVDCPNPSAADDILSDGETEHLVTFTDEGWTIRHPLRERIDDQLTKCALNDVCRDLSGPPPQLGTYRAVPGDDGGYSWTRIPA